MVPWPAVDDGKGADGSAHEGQATSLSSIFTRLVSLVVGFLKQTHQPNQVEG